MTCTIDLPGPLAAYFKWSLFTRMPANAGPPPGEMTQLLAEFRAGDRAAEARLYELAYHELRTVARRHMRGEAAGHTLQTTALVNEACLRLFGINIAWQNRAHFFAVAAQTMRRILVDHARSRRADKRNGGIRVDIHTISLISDSQIDNVIALDTALNKLAAHDGRQAQLVELRFFTGLSLQESAELLGISARTARRDWSFAQAWLYQAMGGAKPGER